jgi:hypothetical protein
MRTDRVLFVALFVAALLQLFIWANVESQPLHKIRIGYPSISSRQGSSGWRKPYPTMRGIQNLIDMSASQIAQAKGAKPEQFVDLSFLQELEAEKFFDEMARRYK